jgi:hypothetical protein
VCSPFLGNQIGPDEPGLSVTLRNCFYLADLESVWRIEKKKDFSKNSYTPECTLSRQILTRLPAPYHVKS